MSVGGRSGVVWAEEVIAVHAGSDRAAVVDGRGPVSGRRFVGCATAAAEFLVGLGLPAGRPVPALLTTNADSLALVLAGAAAGRPLAPLGPRLTASELAGPVRRTGAGVLIAEPAFAAVADEIAATTGFRVVALPAFRPSAQPLRASPEAVAVHLHTSGTTGEARRIALTQQVLSARTEVLTALTGLGPDSRYATGSPLHHIGGLGNVLVALSVGAAVLPTTRFTVDWWRSLRGQGVTHCLLVPSMIEMLLTDGVLDVVDLRTLIYGASPISPETLRRVLRVLPDVDLVNLFGQTEGSPITCLTPQDHERAAAGADALLGSVGRAVPGLRMRLDEPDATGVGEVLAAAPHLSCHDDDGWLHSGDLGTIDDDGYLYLAGRRHDMVVRGGENVYPIEVEHVLAAHPAVAAAGVVGVPDQRLGEVLAAFVVARNPAEPPTDEELRAFTRARLAGFKVPSYWHIVGELPHNAAGKLLRRELGARHR